MVISIIAFFNSKTMTKEENYDITDVIIEKPIAVSIGGKQFVIAPPSLGKTMLIARFMAMLDFRMDVAKMNAKAAIMDVCTKKEDVVCQLIAVLLTSDKEHLVNDSHIVNLAEYVKKHTTIAERCVLLELQLERKPVTHYTKLLGIDRERERLKKVLKVKGQSNSVQFGGVSMFGSMIGAACERYGWTYDYVVWGISYDALQLLIADAIQTIYLTDEEIAKARISTDRTFINGDDPNSINLIRELFK